MKGNRDWLTLLSNFGIIAGLLLVAAQMQQTNEALKIQSADAVVASNTTIHQLWNDWHSNIIANADVAKLWRTGNEGRELNPDDAERYNSLAVRFYLNSLAQFTIFNAGSDELLTGSVDQILSYALENPGFHRWLRNWLASDTVSDGPWANRIRDQLGKHEVRQLSQ